MIGRSGCIGLGVRKGVFGDEIWVEVWYWWLGNCVDSWGKSFLWRGNNSKGKEFEIGLVWLFKFY